jgi:hypothetical protein
VDFDPARIPFERLCELFWAEHDPTERAWSTQYQAVLFAADDAQEAAAKASRDRLAKEIGAEVRTEVRRLDRFWPAEDYHQKYALRGQAALLALARPFAADETALRESPLAAKLNAWAAGEIPFDALVKRCADLGWTISGNGRPASVAARAPEPAAAR